MTNHESNTQPESFEQYDSDIEQQQAALPKDDFPEFQTVQQMLSKIIRIDTTNIPPRDWD